MTVRLADMSDAELGALVRQALSEQTLQTLVQNRDKALRKHAKKRKKAERLAAAEREERKTMETWPEVIVNNVHLPELALSEQNWHEEAPAVKVDAYRRASAAAGVITLEDETFTWMDLKTMHVGFLANWGLREGEGQKVLAVADVLGISRADATKRVIALREGA